MQLPWRRAPRAAFTGPLTVLVTMVAAVVLSFVAAAAVFHTGAAAGAAVSYQESRLCDQEFAPGYQFHGNDFADAKAMLDTARTEGAEHGFTDAVTGVYGPLARTPFGPHHTFDPNDPYLGDGGPVARYGYRDGAFDHLKVLRGGGRDGLWVPRSLAETAGIKLGDRSAGLPVTAIYEDLGEDPPEFWCTERTIVVVPPLADDGSGPVIFTPSLESLRGLVEDSFDGVTATARFRLSAPPATLADAQDLIARGRLATKVVGNQYSPARLKVTTALTRPVANAALAQEKVRDSTLPLTVISLLVGLVGLAAVAVQWCQRRQAELRLLWTRGAGPLALGGRAALELAAPLAVGSGLGLLLADLLRHWYAPDGALPDGARLSAVVLVAVIAVAGLVVITATAALRCRRVFDARRRGGGRLFRWLRFVPWELLTAGLAFVSWQRLLPPPKAPAQHEVLIQADPAGLAFPLLIVLTAALVVARLARIGLALAHRLRWRWTPAHLAVRRLSAARGSAIGVLVVGILAVGTLAVGSGIADAQENGLRAKAGMLVGANSAAGIPLETALDPVKLPADTTVVGISDEPGRALLVVDPATFTRAAWLGDRDPAAVKATLKSLQDKGSPQVLRVNRSPAGPAVEITFQDKANTAAYTPSFPFIGTRPGYVVPRSALKSLRQVGYWQVWSAKPLPELLRELDAAGVAHYATRSADTALDGLPFLTVAWTFTFVAALGLVLAVVAAVALVLAVEVRRRQNALSGALATRMGLGRRSLVTSHALELGGLALLATTAGCATGLITTGVSLPLFDPAPWLRPVTASPHMLPVVLAIYVATAAVVAVVCTTAVRSVRTARVGELLRVTT